MKSEFNGIGDEVRSVDEDSSKRMSSDKGSRAPLPLIFLFGMLFLIQRPMLAFYLFLFPSSDELLLGWLLGMGVGVLILLAGSKTKAPHPFATKCCIALAVLPWLTLAVLVVNVLADSSQPVSHVTTVQYRSMSARRGITYSLNVSSWKSPNERIRVIVTKDCYGRIVAGNTVTVVEEPGAVGIPWIRGVAECP